jgi:hypothetical protein
MVHLFCTSLSRLTKTKFRSFGLYSHENSWVALHGKAVAARTNFNSHVIVYSSQDVFNYNNGFRNLVDCVFIVLDAKL